MTAARAMLALLLALFHAGIAHKRAESKADIIAMDAFDASARSGVPLAWLYAVGWCETHLGTDPGESGSWGAPRRGSHAPGTAFDAAHVLERGYDVCGSWPRAVAYFRSGRCAGDPRAPGYVRRVTALAIAMGETAL